MDEDMTGNSQILLHLAWRKHKSQSYIPHPLGKCEGASLGVQLASLKNLLTSHHPPYRTPVLSILPSCPHSLFQTFST